MVRLIYLLVLFCLILLGGCAGYDKGAIRVSTPSASNVYVAQVDTLVKIVQGKDNIIDLDTGAHRVKVTFVGHTVIDTVVQVKGRKKNVEFGAWMGGMAVSAGVMTLMWSTAWLFILPPTAGVAAMTATMPEKSVVNAVYRNENPVHLYRMEQAYLRVNRLHSELGATERFGLTGVITPVGICYDSALRILWVQRDPASVIYPLDARTDFEMCSADESGMSCLPEKNKLLEAFPCH